MQADAPCLGLLDDLRVIDLRDVSTRAPRPLTGTLLSGPRWRLTPNKIGQDIPGLEVPNVECAPPPYQKDLIKYEVGAPVRTVINLLDWNTTSPIAYASLTRGAVQASEAFEYADQTIRRNHPGKASGRRSFPSWPNATTNASFAASSARWGSPSMQHA